MFWDVLRPVGDSDVVKASDETNRLEEVLSRPEIETWGYNSQRSFVWTCTNRGAGDKGALIEKVSPNMETFKCWRSARTRGQQRYLFEGMEKRN